MADDKAQQIEVPQPSDLPPIVRDARGVGDEALVLAYSLEQLSNENRCDAIRAQVALCMLLAAAVHLSREQACPAVRLQAGLNWGPSDWDAAGIEGSVTVSGFPQLVLMQRDGGKLRAKHAFNASEFPLSRAAVEWAERAGWAYAKRIGCTATREAIQLSIDQAREASFHAAKHLKKRMEQPGGARASGVSFPPPLTAGALRSARASKRDPLQGGAVVSAECAEWAQGALCHK